jgi:hypothetical protein
MAGILGLLLLLALLFLHFSCASGCAGTTHSLATTWWNWCSRHCRRWLSEAKSDEKKQGKQRGRACCSRATSIHGRPLPLMPPPTNVPPAPTHHTGRSPRPQLVSCSPAGCRVSRCCLVAPPEASLSSHLPVFHIDRSITSRASLRCQRKSWPRAWACLCVRVCARVCVCVCVCREVESNLFVLVPSLHHTRP